MDIKLLLDNENYNKESKIIANGEFVGRVAYRADNESLIIDSIYIHQMYREKGIGKAIINKLLSGYKFIYGCSSPLAIGFWIKLGAKFEYDVSEDMIPRLLDIGEYPPFKIESKLYESINS